MTNNDIVLNGKTIGKVFERLEGGFEVWIPHNLIMEALEQDVGSVVFTH